MRCRVFVCNEMGKLYLKYISDGLNKQRNDLNMYSVISKEFIAN